MKKIILILFLIASFFSFAQKDSVFVISEFQDSTKIIPLDKYWKYQSGDDLSWANIKTNDSLWQSHNTDFSINDLSKIKFEGIGWFRLHLFVEEGAQHKPIALLVSQLGASEYYLNGKLLCSFGKPSGVKKNEVNYSPNSQPFIFQFDSAGNHLLAVRYSNQNAADGIKKYFDDDNGFSVSIADANKAIHEFSEESISAHVIFIFLFTFFITIAFLHFLLYLFYRSQKTNLTYSIFILLFSYFFLLPITSQNVTDPQTKILINYTTLFVIPIFFTSLWAFINSLFYGKQTKFFWIVAAVLGIILILKFLAIEPGIVSFAYVCMVTIISTVEVFRAIIKKKKGAWAIGLAAICFLSLILIILFKNAIGLGTGFTVDGDSFLGMLLILLLVGSVLGIPVSMSFYLAREFAQTSKSLSKKLVEVEELSAKNIEQEKEKQKILATQNEMLEEQVKERTSEILEQKKIIEEKNKDITDSINYAKRIQEALLPEQHLLQKLFNESFILYKPKDIVSGDFYWFTEYKAKKIIVAADCTGHGVPGALMSMIGSNTLNKLVLENGIVEPDLILNALHEEVRKSLKQNNADAQTRDGMDIAIICVDENKLTYAGAQRPLWLIRNNDLLETKANKFSIGGIQTEEKRIFKKQEISLEKGDTIYLTTDGFADQFGGKDGKKLMTKNFKELLLKIQNQTMTEQQMTLDTTIEKWKGEREQVDDVLVIGIKI